MDRSQVTRRRFLQNFAAGGAGLALGLPRLTLTPERAAAGWFDPVSYDDWRDIYRQRWKWDRVVRGTHLMNCWYQANCSWNVFVKDGIVWREEQAADYPQVRPDVPDFNPRGCQKGGCFSERMYDASRVRHPLKRVGERGSGKWKRISWEQAVDEIADQILDTLKEHGSDRVVWDIGPLYSMGTQSAAHQRMTTLLDMTALDVNTEIGDGRRGAAETFGKIVFERSADDFFFSDLILIWGGNPIYTQIPNAHFMIEARYKGARIVCIAPDYSASSIHADLYVPVKPGCDAALALSIAHVLIEQNLIDRDFVVEQTDLPLLVREDDDRYLRASDLEQGGDDEELFLHDAARGLVPAPRRSLALEGLQPELEGRFDVTSKDGRKIGVRTVFTRLREQLADYTPEKAAAICGTPAPLIRKLAAQIADARAMSMVTTSNMAKYYHGNLMERGQALVFALTGNFGKKGSGIGGFPHLTTDSLEPFTREMFSVADMMNTTALGVIGDQVRDELRGRWEGYSEEMIAYEHMRRLSEQGRMGGSSALFWYVHGGLLHASEKLHEWDPHLTRPIREVLEESLSKGWQRVTPKPGDDPKALFVLGGNPLRRIRSYPLVLEHLWPKLDLVVTLDFRMSSTALQSDYVLPAAAWYERDEHKWTTALMPYIHSTEKAVSYYEAKSDWEIISRLTEAVARRAKRRGIDSFVDRHGDERPLHDIYERFSSNGAYGHTDDDKVAKRLLELASNLDGLEWEELKKKGWARFTDWGTLPTAYGNQSEIEPDDTITPFEHHVFDKVPYPTLSRRIQFYLDQELYLEMGESLPTHKDPLPAGGDYPLTLTGGHTRWSIHASWRDDALMLQQQRGEPCMWMSAEDADAREIADGDRVRVHNDIDEFEIMIKRSPSVRPGQLLLYHAWENFQFKNGKGYQNLIPTPLNPVELAGGQFHLRPMILCLQPSHTDRDTRVEVAKI
ncbi:MAG: molybdopterin-dependent oxidoreductase [Myxococcota bacterium]|nr:molybdopterin-dependent oxidoreductase [Myxococcota bacterium]